LETALAMLLGLALSQGSAGADESTSVNTDPAGAPPLATAAEAPSPDDPAAAAAARWQRLKAEAAAAPRSTPRAPRKAPPVVPADLWADELAPVAPATGESDWVLATQPLDADEADPPAAAGQITLDASGWMPRKPAIDPTTAIAPIADPSAADGVIPTSAQMHSIVWPLLGLQDPRRKLRDITEISPHYDTTVDKDIRDYAEEQAASYGLTFADTQFTPRAFPDMMMPWMASNFYHYPLYFEDPALERYGHTYGFVAQPFVSAARFSGQLVMLPYQMTIDPILKPTYTLGWYRPGDVAPKLRYQIPWNWKAAAVEAGVVTGLVFLIP
jgi:hypothetical protein